MFNGFLNCVRDIIADSVAEGFRKGLAAAGFKLHDDGPGKPPLPYLAPPEEKAKPRRGGKIDARRVPLRKKIDPALKRLVDERLKIAENGDGGSKPAA